MMAAGTFRLFQALRQSGCGAKKARKTKNEGNKYAEAGHFT